jgi:opacity protein-like surface antigen
MRHILLLIVALASFNTSAKLKAWNDNTIREKGAELSMGFRKLGEYKFEGKQSGVLKGQSNYGFLLEGGYNYTRNWYFGGFFSLNSGDYKADIVADDGTPKVIHSSLSFFDLQFITRFNFFHTALTPYVEAGIGMTSIDTGVPSGDIIETCWWDPLFNQYVCGFTQPNKSVTDLSATLGFGVRYEVTNNGILKIGSNYRIINNSNTKSRPDLWDITFTVGMLID